MKKLDIYIIKKFLGTFFYALLLIISISVVFDFSEKIDEFIEKQAPAKAIIFDYYLNFIPYFANLFSYLFTFISVIFFTSKMAGNTEIIAILSSGVSYRRLLVPYFIAAGIIALFSYVLSSYIIPDANKKRLDFEYQYIKNPYRNVEVDIHKQIGPNTFIYFENFHVDRQIGYQFALEKFEDGNLVSKLRANHMRWDSTESQWEIHNYYQRFFDGDQERIEFGRQKDTVLNLTPNDFIRLEGMVETMTTPELNQFIKRERQRGTKNIELYLIEKHKRNAAPFATFILTLIGVSISSRKVRGGTGLHIGTGLFLSFTYILFFQISSQFAISGGLNTLFAVWIPNIIYGIIALYLYKMAPK